MEDRIVELTSRLVAIDTTEVEGAAQELLAGTLEACGFDCAFQDVTPERPNLVARRGDGGPFLCSHVDTHPLHGQPDPLTCRRDGDVLTGRGVLDAKGQIAALVAALEAEPDAPALVAITCDEEAAGLGSAAIALPSGDWFTDGGVVLEPTDFKVCTAQSGHIDVHVEATGRPGHAYGPEPSGSPISAVLAAADALETCAFLADRHPVLPPASMRIGRISGGEHLWRHPMHASIDLGTGLVPATEVDVATEEIRSRLDDLARRWDARGVSLTYGIDASPAIEVPVELPIARRVREAAAIDLERAGMPSWTDAANLLVHHGLPCVVFGAGELTTAHSDHESVRVTDLVRLSEILRALLTSGGTAR